MEGMMVSDPPAIGTVFTALTRRRPGVEGIPLRFDDHASRDRYLRQLQERLPKDIGGLTVHLQSTRGAITEEERRWLYTIFSQPTFVFELHECIDNVCLDLTLKANPRVKALYLPQGMLWRLDHLDLFAVHPSALVIVPIFLKVHHLVGMDILYKPLDDKQIQ